MKKPNFLQLTGKDYSMWIYPKQRGFVIGCCGCGLAHSFNFRVNTRQMVEFQIRLNPIVTDKIRKKEINIK